MMRFDEVNQKTKPRRLMNGKNRKKEKFKSPNFFARKKTPPTDKRRDPFLAFSCLVRKKTEKKINNQKKEVCVISPFLLASIII